MAFIPFNEYLPDQPDYQNPGSNLLQNVLPKTSQSYGPFPSLTVVGGALTARCQGAYAMQDASGNVRIFYGDATNLYLQDPGNVTPYNVNKAATTYTTGSTERWSMCLFGQRVIATNYTDPPQSFVYVDNTTKFTDLITSGTTSLTFRYSGVVKDFYVAGNTAGGGFGAQPQRVWWSAIDDPTNFPTPGTSAAAAVQSDYQDLVGDAGWVQGIVGNLGTADGAIFQERAVVRMTYVGPPAIFAFSTAEGVRGTPAPGSIIQVSNLAYYLGEDGFYAFDGTSSQPIGFDKVDKEFFSDLDQSYFYRITATYDPINKIIMWAYPGAGHSGGNPNRIICYHYGLNRWSITAPGDITMEMFTRALSFGYTLEQLDAVSASIDALTPSLDSRVWTGGRSLLACVNTDHKLCYFTGTSLAVTAETTEAEPVPGRIATITRARPVVDTTAATIQIGTRNRLADSESYGSAVAMDASGSCPVRATGRYMHARLAIPAGTTWTHLQGVEVPDDEIHAGGKR